MRPFGPPRGVSRTSSISWTHRSSAWLCLILAQAIPARAQAQGTSVELRRNGETALELVDDRPVVTAYINGAGPFRLGIETGAPYRVIVPSTVAAKMSLAGGTTFGARTVVDSLRTGDALFRNVELAVSGDLGIAGIDGMIGLAAFSDLQLVVDFPRGRVRFTKDTLARVDGRSIQPLKSLGGLVGIDVSVGGTPVVLLVDTQGGGQGIACHPTVTSTMAFEGPTVVTGQAQIGVGNPRPVELRSGRLASDVAIGGITLRRPIISSFPLPDGVPCILGLTVLKQFAVALDQRTMRLRLDGPTSLAPSPSLYSAGINIAPDAAGKLVVRVVRAGSAAEAAGVRVGDEVTHLAGAVATVANTSPAAVRAVVARGQPFPMTIRRADASLTVQIAPQLLLK